MKKKVSVLFGVIFAVVFAFALTACGKVSLKLTFKVDGVDYATISTSGDEVISMPENPTKDGYTFEGWFWDEGTWQKPFTANSFVDTPISSDTSVYAKLVAAHKHSFSKEWSKNAVYHWRVATCDDTDEISDKAEHVFADGMCATCGIAVTPTSDFNFKEVEDGYEIIGYIGKSDYVIIPDTYNDKPIVGLLQYPFMTNYTVEDPYLGIQTLLLSENIKRIGDETLALAMNLNYIGVDKDNEYFKSIDGNLYSKDGKTLCAYAYAKRDVYFEIPYGVEKINKYAMSACHLLSLTVPETVTDIDPNGIKGVKLAEIFNFSGQEILNLDHEGHSTLPVYPTIYTDKTAKSKFYYIQSDYVVFDDNGVIVLASYIGNEKEAVLPQKIDRVTLGAFLISEDTESIILDGKVSELEDYSLSSYKLKKVKIAGKIKKVGNVFNASIGSLSEIYLGDNVEEFIIPYSGINYTVSENNTHYKSIDGNLYSKDGKTLYSARVEDSKMLAIPEGVEIIYDRAFFGCVELRSVTIPKGVKSIGNHAFNGCNRLTSVTIGNSVMSIGDYAFNGCNRLTSVTIGSSVTSIGNYAFNGCYHLVEVYNLSSLNIVKGDSGYGYVARYAIDIYNNISVPSKLTKENDFVTYTEDGGEITLVGYFGEKTSITVPDDVTKIGDYAFFYCSNLTGISMGINVTEIGNYAFYCCRNLTSVAMGNSVTSIGKYAFGCCYDLTSIKIPDSVTSIGYGAFERCSSLTSVTIPNSVEDIKYQTFRDCSSLTNVTIGVSVTSIGEGAFKRCNNLTSVYYKGNAEDWAEVSISWDNDYLTSATRYYYSETEPELNSDGTAYDGNYWRYVGGVPTVWKKES